MYWPHLGFRTVISSHPQPQNAARKGSEYGAERIDLPIARPSANIAENSNAYLEALLTVVHGSITN